MSAYAEKRAAHAPSTTTPARRRPWSLRALEIAALVPLDCAYLIRSRHTRRNKARILLTYLRLTIKVLFGADPAGLRRDRVLGFRVRHFGGGSLQLLFREIFLRNEYYFLASTPRPFILDCGANIGLATLFFKWLYPSSEIHAFEPDSETCAVLKENVEANGLADVHVHNVALCDENRRLEFFVPRNGAGSLVMSLVPGRIGTADSRRIMVEGRTLSTYAEGRDVDFMKMDIEGAEQRVVRELAGAGTLQRVRGMVVEYHHNLDGAGSLARFLQILEDAGLHYQVDARRGAPGQFQDILVCAAPAANGSADEAYGA